MTSKTVYIAFDGKEFNSEFACGVYENVLAELRRKTLLEKVGAALQGINNVLIENGCHLEKDGDYLLVTSDEDNEVSLLI